MSSPLEERGAIGSPLEERAASGSPSEEGGAIGSPSEELGAIVTRLEQAAARLKDEAGVPRARDGADDPQPPRAIRTPPAERRRLGEVLDGLERANVEVRRARARLAELEARLGLRDAA